MHEKPRDNRGQGKHTAPPRAARKTHLKRRAATVRRGSRPKNLPRATKDGGHLPRRSARREGSRTPCQKRENAPEATRSAAGIQGHPQQRKPRRGHAERPQDKHSNSRRTTCQGRPPEEQTRTAAEIRTAAEAAPESARTREKAHKHLRQGKTTAHRRGGKKRSQSSERGTPRRSAARSPCRDQPEPPAANISAQDTPRTHAESRPNHLPQPRHTEKGAQNE